MKLAKVVLVTAICSASLSVTAFAGTWKTGANENANRWWYDNGNGTYAKDVFALLFFCPKSDVLIIL